MGIIVVFVVVLIVAALIAAVVLIMNRRAGAKHPVPHDVAPGRAPEQPMTGLESALAQVTDRSGRPIGERIEAEADHVEEFRVVDDTGPLLRRALDHVAPPPGEQPVTDAGSPPLTDPVDDPVDDPAT